MTRVLTAGAIGGLATMAAIILTTAGAATVAGAAIALIWIMHRIDRPYGATVNPERNR
jgi:predicted nicotinamide N-methyase